jgi:hypothetical protein
LDRLSPAYKVKRTVHKCSFCGKDFLWNSESQWYGNYKIHKQGHPDAWETENIMAKACANECVEAMKRVYG